MRKATSNVYKKERKQMKKLRTLSTLLALIAVFTLVIPALNIFAETVNAPITQTVNLATVSKNARGSGFEWNNLTNTLTLDNMTINTADEFGMKLPKDATVILKGKNYITAANVGLVCTGQVTFEGGGTLTIVAGDVGMDMTGVYTSHFARFQNCRILIDAGKTAIRSSTAELSFMNNCGLTLTITGDRTVAKAIDGRNVIFSGGGIAANAGIYASNSLKISSSNIDIMSETPALECPNGITITKESISAGDTAATRAIVESYNGEKSLLLTSTAKNKTPSILFGDGASVVLDYVVFTLLIVTVAALIAVPVYLKKKKTEKLIAEYEAANSAKKNKTSPKTKNVK